MNKNANSALIAAVALVTLAACGQSDNQAQEAESAAAPAPSSAPPEMPRTPSVDDAAVVFVTPRDGATVSNPVILNFAATGMSVVKSGDNTPKSGHHHVIIDAELPPMNLPIPADANHVHFGDGSSTTELELTPGEHTLQLLFADHLHIPHDPPIYSEQITITVE